MRDRVLCRGCAEPKIADAEEAFPCGNSYFSVLTSSFTLLSDAVPVSIQGGVKMSINEILGFLDNTARINQKVHKFLEISRQELDTICVTKSLFKGTFVDFDFCSHSGGGNYANSFAVN
jgi:hypothetical protein